MKLPTITAIIPLFNHDKFVKDSIFSIINQNYPNLRLVVVDDCSTDKSWETVCGLCNNIKQLPTSKTDEPAELMGGNITQYQIILARFGQNRGPSAARNYAIKIGNEGTDLYQFLDADDILLKNKLIKSVDLLMNAPDLIGLVYSDFICENIQNGQLTREFRPAYIKENLFNDCLPNMNSLFNKKVFDKVGLFDETLRVAEDLDMYFRISEHFMICHLPEALVQIRTNNPNNTTNKYNSQYWQESRSKIYAKMQARLNN